MNILLTGRPGIGKTTVMEKLALKLDSPSGFVTREIRERGRRMGFSISTFDGAEAVLARRGGAPGPRVGPYAVCLDGLEEIGVCSIDVGISRQGVILIDEIGKMESKSAAFRKSVEKALDSGSDVVATVGVSNDSFLKQVRSRPDLCIMEVTLANRNELPGLVLEMLESGRKRGNRIGNESE